MPFVPVIVCGGSGTRLWPLSRRTLPKPFVVLPGRETSLIGATYARVGEIGRAADAVITVTSAETAFLCESSYAQSGLAAPHVLVAEPSARNTAGAIAVATEVAYRRFGEDTVLLVMPADHLIDHAAAFQAVTEKAIRAAQLGRIALIGIPPDFPATGYGYIEAGAELENDIHEVARFIEKPDYERAAVLVKDSRIFWNGGLFCFAAKTGKSEFESHCPETVAALSEALTDETAHPIAPQPAAYGRIPAISFDYAVMEKTTKAAVVRGDNLGWSDIGSWGAVAETAGADEAGNVNPDGAALFDCRGCFVAAGKRLVVGVGLNDVYVVDTPDALLVADAAASQDIRSVVDALANRSETQTPVSVPRPWGRYTVLSEEAGYKVKRIDVAPGQQLSYQSHRRRSEHWTTVEGVMTVVLEGETFDMPVNHSCHIPLGAKHRMLNKTDRNAALIEVQIGDYLGEDDIVRYEDIYGRADGAS